MNDQKYDKTEKAITRGYRKTSSTTEDQVSKPTNGNEYSIYCSSVETSLEDQYVNSYVFFFLLKVEKFWKELGHL